MITEDLVKFLWKYRLFTSIPLKTISGKIVEIVSPGEINSDAGPDFFNAKIKLDGVLWAGNVEIHTDSSYWERHGHHTDRAYNNVILHVVTEYKRNVYTLEGRELETLVVEVDDYLMQRFWQLQYSDSKIPCAPFINDVSILSIKSWLDALAAERLETRINAVNLLVEQLHGDWEETLYRYLARSLGTSLNSLPFEMLAKAAPLALIRRHCTTLTQAEALLFGQAGLLAEDDGDSYFLRIKKEYAYLSHKLGLKPMDGAVWKFARTRPPNFPTVRIAQLAALSFFEFPLLARLGNINHVEQLPKILTTAPSSYWRAHYTFNHPSPQRKVGLGKEVVLLVILNAFIPVLYAFNKSMGNEVGQQLCLTALEKLDPENNAIIKQWKSLGIPATNALDSQALLQLYKGYCVPKKCLYCRIGATLLTKKA
ncbi:DUF2851 family protein [Williamwhitmania taraxaci]|uniref:DUF2851 domain-containing protein n=1 Tax=Williamwhitmania taraxaci TaxID=1640674 RepID=A0A1G6JMX8_9BACT|nr:DUF2851 family protein [Williamwhitmania taraxaci]SDC19316.1 Protein of unknown function [Williamwhitmania taraxaci]